MCRTGGPRWCDDAATYYSAYFCASSPPRGTVVSISGISEVVRSKKLNTAAADMFAESPRGVRHPRNRGMRPDDARAGQRQEGLIRPGNRQAQAPGARA